MLRCTQRAGDLIALPQGWWHATYSSADAGLVVAIGGQGDSSPAAAVAMATDMAVLGMLHRRDPGLLNQANSLGEAAIHVATAPVLQWLADHGADLNLRTADSRTAAHAAAARGDISALAWFHAHGVSAASVAQNGQQPIHFAAEAGAVDTVAWLCEHGGAEVDARSNDGQTALHSAARAASVAVMRWLVDHGADVHAARTADGATAGHFVASAEDGLDAKVAALEWLYARGVPMWSQTSDGLTPADIAAGAPAGAAELTAWFRAKRPRRADL